MIIRGEEERMNKKRRERKRKRIQTEDENDDGRKGKKDFLGIYWRFQIYSDKDKGIILINRKDK